MISQRDPFLQTVPGPCEPEDLIDGIIFAANYLGCTQVLSDKNPSKSVRMSQAHEAIGRIKVIRPHGVCCCCPVSISLMFLSPANIATCLRGILGGVVSGRRSSVSGVELNLGFMPADEFPSQAVDAPTAESKNLGHVCSLSVQIRDF